MIRPVVSVFAQRVYTCFTYSNFLLYSPSDTSSTFVSGRSPISAVSCKKTHFYYYFENVKDTRDNDLILVIKVYFEFLVQVGR